MTKRNEQEWRRAKVRNWANSAVNKIPMIKPAPKRLPPMRLSPVRLPPVRRPAIRTTGLLDSNPVVKKQTHPTGLLNLKKA